MKLNLFLYCVKTIIIVIIFSFGLKSATAQTPTSCQFDKDVSQSWNNANSIYKTDPKNAEKVHREGIAIAIQAWADRGIASPGNTDGLVPNKDNMMLSEAMACYVMEAICDMPRKKMAYKTYKSFWKTEHWSPNTVVPQFAPKELVEWSEKKLGCKAGMTPLSFNAPKPNILASQHKDPKSTQSSVSNTRGVSSASPQQSDGQVIARTRNPDGTGTVTTRRIIKTAQTPHVTTRCDRGEREACRQVFEDHKKSYLKTTSAEARKARKVLAEYWARKACRLGETSLCNLDLKMVSQQGTMSVSVSSKPYKFQVQQKLPESEFDAAIQACNQKNIESCRKLFLHFKGAPTGQKSLFWAEKACKMGASDMCFAAGDYHSNGNFLVKSDPKRGFPLLVAGCKLSSGESCHGVALAFKEGKGTVANLSQAQVNFEKACNLGHRKSCEAGRIAKYNLNKRRQSQIAAQRRRNAPPTSFGDPNALDRSTVNRAVKDYRDWKSNNSGGSHCYLKREANGQSRRVCVTKDYARRQGWIK